MSGREGERGRRPRPVRLRPGEAAPAAREAAGRGGVRARDPEAGARRRARGAHAAAAGAGGARRCRSGRGVRGRSAGRESPGAWIARD